MIEDGIRKLKNKPKMIDWVKSTQRNCPYIYWVTQNKISYPHCKVDNDNICRYKTCKRIR